MERNYLRFLVLAAVPVLLLLIGSMFSGDYKDHTVSGAVVYAEEGHSEHDDHEDCEKHGSHAEDTEKTGRDGAAEDGVHAEPAEHGDHEVHESHAEVEHGEHEEQDHGECSGHSGHEPSGEPRETEDVHTDHSGHEDDAHNNEHEEGEHGETEDVHTDHSGHEDDVHNNEHEEGEHGETEDAHPGHQDEFPGEDHEGHDHHGEDLVHLSPGAIRLAGIRVTTARMGRLRRTIELPGEIGFNEDRLVHVTPRFPGVAREVHGHTGAYVRAGDLLAVLESNESLSRYNVTAPISGRIIEKHLAVGEFVAEDHDMFLVADLSTVWANCEVYAKDVAYVKQGARVRINTVEGGRSTEAVLSYVAPVYDGETRSALARAVIVNDGDLWRPGTFIRAELELEMEDERLTVAKDAVQTLGEERVVFVPAEEEGAFELVPVVTGTGDDHSIEIMSGLTEGAQYVADGAFELKAKMVTANMGAHAGHGH